MSQKGMKTKLNEVFLRNGYVQDVIAKEKEENQGRTNIQEEQCRIRQLNECRIRQQMIIDKINTLPKQSNKNAISITESNWVKEQNSLKRQGPCLFLSFVGT